MNETENNMNRSMPEGENIPAEDSQLSAEDSQLSAEDSQLSAEDSQLSAEDYQLSAEDSQLPVEDGYDPGSHTEIVVEDIDEKSLEKLGEDGKKRMNPVLEWVIIIAIAVAAALFINFVIIINSVVPSGSMETTIMTNSRMMGLRVTYWFSDPQRGDIIVFKYPDDPSENFVKRVIGLPGETVVIIDGVTYVNGEALDEPYLKETPLKRDFGPYEVPEGCYFVMGDNRNNSHDARFWKNTYVPRSSVLGKAMFVYWPISRIGPLK